MMTESLAHEGPGRYSNNIRMYWERLGFKVRTRDFITGDSYGDFWCVRSDMKNGNPCIQQKRTMK